MEAKNKKNCNGEGSISKRSDGRFQGSIMYDGVRKYFYGKTEKEVKLKIREFQAKHLCGINECSVIFSDYFNYWLMNCKKGKLKPASFDRLERTYNNYISKELGKIPVAKLTTRQCQTLINKNAEIHSYSTTKKIYEAINACMEYASNVGDINRNPMYAVELPRESNFKKKTKDIIIPTEDEMQKIIDTGFQKYSNGKPIYYPVYAYVYILIANTGLRAGEVLALTWDKVDFINSLLKVDCSMSEIIDRVNDNKRLTRITTETKTKNGSRIIYLNNKTVDALMQIRTFYSRYGISNEHVICNSKGEQSNYHDLQRTFARVIRRAKVKPIGLHTLRHYFASLTLSRGANVQAVSQMLGHGKTSVTMNTYGHLMPKQNEEFQQLLDVI